MAATTRAKAKSPVDIADGGMPGSAGVGISGCSQCLPIIDADGPLAVSRSGTGASASSKSLRPTPTVRLPKIVARDRNARRRPAKASTMACTPGIRSLTEIIGGNLQEPCRANRHAGATELRHADQTLS